MTRTMTIRQTSAETFLRIICAALMLSLGFAHKPINAASVAVIQDEAYRLPDGTFAEICFGHVGGASAGGHGLPGHPDIAASLFCEACLLASSILLPAPDAGSWLRTEFSWLVNALTAEHAFDEVSRTDRAKARAPPLTA